MNVLYEFENYVGKITCLPGANKLTIQVNVS